MPTLLTFPGTNPMMAIVPDHMDLKDAVKLANATIDQVHADMQAVKEKLEESTSENEYLRAMRETITARLEALGLVFVHSRYLNDETKIWHDYPMLAD